MPVLSASSLSAIGPAAASRQRISRKPTPIDWILRGLLELEMRIGDHLAELDHVVLDRVADQRGRAAHRLDALIAQRLARLRLLEGIVGGGVQPVADIGG